MIARRTALVLCSLGLLSIAAHAQTDPLPSWNDGAAKRAIVAFVTETTTAGRPGFVPEAERIATFDQDGTPWVEKPMYSQIVYCLDRVPAVVKAKPESKTSNFKTVLSGDREAIAQLTKQHLGNLSPSHSAG